MSKQMVGDVVRLCGTILMSNSAKAHGLTSSRHCHLPCEAPLFNTQLVVPAVYRVGTLLEMVRDMATALALDGKRVKVCVQAAMGQGVFQVSPALRRAPGCILIKSPLTAGMHPANDQARGRVLQEMRR
jgi:hypothetical protein